MLDLKERLKALDQTPVPDLAEVIRRRARKLTADGAVSRPFEERWASRRRYRLRPGELFAVAALIAFAIGLAVFAHYARTLGPVKYQPPPPPPGSGSSGQRASMHMIDGSRGWVFMGPSPTVAFRKTGGEPLQDWIDVTPRDAVSGNELVSAFLDDVTAWVLSVPTSMPASRSADVWRTVNGGRSWQRIARPNITPWYGGVRRPDRLVFVDRHNGWFTVKISSAVGLSMVIYRTDDGGVTWTEVSVPPATPGHGTPRAIPVGCTGELTFTNALDGWVPATCPEGDRLFSSRDGGHTWSWQTFTSQAPTAIGDESHFESPVQASGPAGFLYFIWGNGTRSNLYVSKDDGTSWSALLLPGSLVTDRTPPMFVGENGWFVANAGVYRTTDGGHHWARIDAAMDGWVPTRLQFVDETLGWALARRSGRLGVLRTIDGGRSWFLSWQGP